jgi:hypothetical protein
MYTEKGMKSYFDSFPNKQNTNRLYEFDILQGNVVDVDYIINHLHDLSYSELIDVQEIILILLEKKECR